MRPTDRLAVLGLMLGALGAAIFVAGKSAIPMWIQFLVGPMLWYFGLALLLAWALLRALPIVVEPLFEEAKQEKAQPIEAPASNFLEHDYSNIA